MPAKCVTRQNSGEMVFEVRFAEDRIVTKIAVTRDGRTRLRTRTRTRTRDFLKLRTRTRTWANSETSDTGSELAVSNLAVTMLAVSKLAVTKLAMTK